jgi:hypothetical protein
MSLVLNSTSGGSVTIAEPATASNFTQTLAAATGTVPVAATSGVLNAGSVSGTMCRAWVNFNGTGTVAIRADFNVSSITDNGVGDYTVNFATAMADVNYAVTGMANWDGTARGAAMGINQLRTKTASALPIVTFQSANYGLFDPSEIDISIFR